MRFFDDLIEPARSESDPTRAPTSLSQAPKALDVVNVLAESLTTDDRHPAPEPGPVVRSSDAAGMPALHLHPGLKRPPSLPLP